MFALLAMAGDLGGSIGPGIVGRVTQSAGDNIRAGMGVGLLFPVTLLIIFLFLQGKRIINEIFFQKVGKRLRIVNGG